MIKRKLRLTLTDSSRAVVLSLGMSPIDRGPIQKLDDYGVVRVVDSNHSISVASKVPRHPSVKQS